MRPSAVIVCAGLAAAVLFAACTGSPPEILHAEAELLLLVDPVGEEAVEVLRLFVAVRDRDGADDPATILVTSESHELSWEFTREEWVTVEYGGDTWYGMPELRGVPGSPLPRGRYRVVVEDRSLARDESDFHLTAPPTVPPTDRLPRLLVSGDTYRIDSDEEVVLRVYNRVGNLVVDRRVTSGLLPREIESQLPRESGLSAYLYALAGPGPRQVVGPFELRR